MSKTLWGLVAGSMLVLAASAPVSASEATTLTIANVSRAGTSVSLSGTVTLGTAAFEPVQVGSDAAADEVGGAAPLATGTDLVKASVGLDAQKRLVFTVEVSDPPSQTDSIAPMFSYLYSFGVNGEDSGRYVRMSNHLSGGKSYFLCKRDAAANSLSCPNSLTGSMSNGKTTATVPLNRVGAVPGSTIDPGALGGGTTCPGLCATWTEATTTYNTGGDDMALESSYIIPGGVEAAVVPVTTPDAAINFKTVGSATTAGAWAATVTVPNLVAGNQYKAAVRSCHGVAETPTCVVTTQLFTA